MEWTVVAVITALVGLGVSVLTPIIKLNTSIVKLNTTMDNLNKIVSESSVKLDNLERRVTIIETRSEDK